MGAADLPLLREWLARAHVAEWWDAGDFAEPFDRAAGTQGFIALLDGAPAGFIQSYVVLGSGGGWWEDETDPGARGIDQFLADDARLGQGLGSAMVRAFVDRLFMDPEVTRVQTDPDPRNERAIRACERAGFRRARVVATPDGPALLLTRTRS